jgi:APA family basic amino acid/polyamine antiporter
MSATPAPSTAEQQPSLLKGLSLLDTVMLLVGGVIGSGIFLTAGPVATATGRPSTFLLTWIAGGVISLLACFAVAELGGMFPEAGGQYVYLREAYGELPAFLYGWMIFAVVQTGTIGALAVGFGQYFGALFPAFGSAEPLLTIGKFALTVPKIVSVIAIAILTAVNVFGVKRGSLLVNVATWLKYGAMAALVVFGLALGKGDWSHFSHAAPDAPASTSAMLTGFGVALISVLFAYDGWVYVTWVAGEVKDAARNIPRALIIGTVLVMIIYVSMNVVYVYALPMETISRTQAVVSDAATALFSSKLAIWLTLMVAVSVFGSMGSAILCTARIFYAMAHDGVFFKKMGEVHPKYRTPSFALIMQSFWAAVLTLVGLYDQLLTYAIFMMIVGYIATVAGVIVLRKKRPDHPRPYRCWGYPVVPILYILVATAWTLNTVVASPWESLGGLALVLLGIPGYIYWTRNRAVTT